MLSVLLCLFQTNKVFPKKKAFKTSNDSPIGLTFMDDKALTECQPFGLWPLVIMPYASLYLFWPILSSPKSISSAASNNVLAQVNLKLLFPFSFKKYTN